VLYTPYGVDNSVEGDAGADGLCVGALPPGTAMALGGPPSPEIRERADSRRKRLRLLAATRQAIAEHGLNISTADIAARAEVGIGTIYRRFGSKEALIEAVLNDGASAAVADASRALAEQDPAVGLEMFMSDLCRHLVANRGLRQFGTELRAKSHSIPALQQIGYLRDMLKSLTERAQQAGVVRDDVTWRDLAIFARATATDEDALAVAGDKEQWQRILAVLMDGLRTAGSRELPGQPPSDLHL
jgi:AcrR family transcriptional regulator